ncbi:MAG TPA: hypothetical protein VGK80_05805, partial [Rhodanobacteraceae bacterium]
MFTLYRAAAAAVAIMLGGIMIPRVAVADCTPSFRQVNVDGFGNRYNLYAWSMQVFNGRLFVGTMNQQTGGEIWAYDGTQWQQVLKQNMRRTGNTGFRSMIIFHGFLFTGGTNDTYGAELWRTSDGVHWRKIVAGGFGDKNNESIRGVAIFQDKLYIGLQNASGSGGQLWRSADGVTFEPVNTDGFGDTTNISMHSMAVLNGQLYIGTKNKDTLLQVWRTSDGDNYEQVVGPNAAVPSGFGIPDNILTQSMYVYNNVLYLGTGNSKPNGDSSHGFSVMRTTNGTQWQPITVNGGGDIDNRFAWRFFAYQGYLWMGIGNFNIENGEGGQALRSVTGNQGSWEVMVGPNSPYAPTGFGNWMNWGIRTFAEYNGKLYLGTAQCWQDWCDPDVTGAAIWEWSGETCPAPETALNRRPGFDADRNR